MLWFLTPIFAAMDLSALAPIIVALVAGGGVALFTARPHKDSIIAEAANRAVDVVSAAIARLEEELKQARERIAVLEDQLAREQGSSLRLKTLEAELRVAHEAHDECQRRAEQLRDVLVEHGLPVPPREGDHGD